VIRRLTVGGDRRGVLTDDGNPAGKATSAAAGGERERVEELS
jgi:hypothetical protein